jgi:hypothetical protein
MALTFDSLGAVLANAGAMLAPGLEVAAVKGSGGVSALVVGAVALVCGEIAALISGRPGE